MAVVKINAIEIPEGAGAELERRFAARLGAMEQVPGFLGFELLRPVAGENRYFVYTRWADDEAYRAWAAGSAREAHGRGDGATPAGGGATGGPADGGRTRPVATGATLLEFEVVHEVGPSGR